MGCPVLRGHAFGPRCTCDGQAHRSPEGSEQAEAIPKAEMGYPLTMTKRLIEVDDEKLDAIRSLLGTQTLKATVDGAFEEVLSLDRRRRALLAERGADLVAMTDPDARQSAWG